MNFQRDKVNFLMHNLGRLDAGRESVNKGFMQGNVSKGHGFHVARHSPHSRPPNAERAGHAGLSLLHLPWARYQPGSHQISVCPVE